MDNSLVRDHLTLAACQTTYPASPVPWLKKKRKRVRRKKEEKKIKRLAWPHCMQNGAFPAEMGVQRALV